MPKFKKNDRVVIAGTGELGTVAAVVKMADGLWAEQFYSLRLDGNDLCHVTIQEQALAPAESS